MRAISTFLFFQCVYVLLNRCLSRYITHFLIGNTYSEQQLQELRRPSNESKSTSIMAKSFLLRFHIYFSIICSESILRSWFWYEQNRQHTLITTNNNWSNFTVSVQSNWQNINALAENELFSLYDDFRKNMWNVLLYRKYAYDRSTCSDAHYSHASGVSLF